MKNIVLALIVLTSCSPRVRVTVQDDFDFPVGNYGSYSWKGFVPLSEDKMHTYYSPLTDARIRSSVDAVMLSKGYRLLNSGGGLQLHYHVILEDKTIETTESYDYESSTYWFRDELDPYYYTQGTLIIDIVDRKNDCLIWRSRAVGILDDMRAERLERDIDKVVARMLKTLPRSRSTKMSSPGNRVALR